MIFFESIYRNQGIRAASDELGISASTLSKTCEFLESHIDKKLFNKIGHKLVCTSHADALYKQVEDHIYHLKIATDRFTDSKKISFLSQNFITLKSMIAIKNDFYHRFEKNLNIDFRYFNSEDRKYNYELLKNSKVDFIVDSVKPEYWNFDYKEVYKDRWVFFSSTKIDNITNSSEINYIIPNKDLSYLVEKSANISVIEDCSTLLDFVYESRSIGISTINTIRSNRKFKVIETSNNFEEISIYLIYDKRKARSDKALNWFLNQSIDRGLICNRS